MVSTEVNSYSCFDQWNKTSVSGCPVTVDTNLSVQATAMTSACLDSIMPRGVELTDFTSLWSVMCNLVHLETLESSYFINTQGS